MDGTFGVPWTCHQGGGGRLVSTHRAGRSFLARGDAEWGPQILPGAGKTAFP